jgi:hypothetical protein
MDDAIEVEEGDRDVPTWADLFERGAVHGVDESTVREALARRRERADDD